MSAANIPVYFTHMEMVGPRFCQPIRLYNDINIFRYALTLRPNKTEGYGIKRKRGGGGDTGVLNGAGTDE